LFTPNLKRLTAKLDSSKRVFGLNSDDFWIKMNTTFTLWNREGSYGTHPVYFNQLKRNNNFVAVFNANAGAQDIIVSEIPSEDMVKVTHVLTTGIIDLYVMFEGNVNQMSKKLRYVTGNTVLPPKWSFGWMQSRYGYNNSASIETIYNGYKENSIPLEALWVDIDYMNQH
jgi:alpha-glucosidase (family GH31 glycosyl hydrolase)